MSDCKLGGCSKIGCEGGFYCFNADGTRKVVTEEKKQELRDALNEVFGRKAEQSHADHVDLLKRAAHHLREHGSEYGHPMQTDLIAELEAAASKFGAAREFDECVASGGSCSYAPEGRHDEMQCRYCGKAQSGEPVATVEDLNLEVSDGSQYKYKGAILNAKGDALPHGTSLYAERSPLMQWQDGAGLLWDVYGFGKWLKRIISPLGWDAHSVYLAMLGARYAPHIDIRLVSSTNDASPDAPGSPQKPGCEVCADTKGGVPGNENLIDGKRVCDYCHADGSYKSPQAVQTAESEVPLTCDFCGAPTDDPWHTSSATEKHLHQCDACHEDPDASPIQQRSDAWFSVCRVLNEVMPEWRGNGPTRDKAIEAIRKLATAASQQASDAASDLAFSVYSGLNALRWLLNLTTEFDRKDVRTRQAARLLDEYTDSFGKTNRERLEDMWKTLNDKLPNDGRISEYLRAHDAAGRALKGKGASND